ncbi:MAG TPA: GAF domain-containing protein, partial [Rhodocyclaceae bacterium]|nr:GAF domain-containing protein [Rhodocyclaceae bacterium]
MTRPHPGDNLPALLGKLERLNQLYAMLSDINRSILRGEVPHELYDAACRIAVESGAFGFAWIGLVEPAGLRLVADAQAGIALSLLEVSLIRDPAEADRWPIATAVREGRPRIVDDIAATDCAGRHALLEAGMRALAVLPLRLDGKVVGVFAVAAREAGCFKEEAELHLLTEVADDISFALEIMRRDEQHTAAETKIQYLAHYDAQTGIPARQLFLERLSAACEAAGDNPLAVLTVNLRRYHGVLQVLGQSAGVELARVIVGRLEALLPTSAIGRLTESEFATFLPAAADALHLVEETAWNIHAALAQTIATDGRDIFLDPFIGIAVYPKDGKAAETLEAAMIAAASTSADSTSVCRFYVTEMDKASRHRLDLEAALRRALERNEFVLHYQP